MRTSNRVSISLALATATFVIAAYAPASFAAGSQESAASLFTNGQTHFAFRYRFEYVNQDAINDKARASTLRSRVNFQSGGFHDFSFFGEIDDVHEVIWDDFNAGSGNTPNRTQYPVVADPEGTEVNQAYIDYKGLLSTRIRIGRQRISLDNQRFIGPVAWRQNEQTFDAASLSYDTRELKVFYAFVTNVNTIAGEDVAAGDLRQDATQLLNAKVGIGDYGQLTGYVYDINDDNVAFNSTRTFGARFVGDMPLSNFKLGYAGEFARQYDAHDNSTSFCANYFNADVSLADEVWKALLGIELLGGDTDKPGEQFRTPFATLHAFNGWADKFLATPQAGLQDVYLKGNYTLANIQLQGQLHSYSAEDGGTDYGDELDLGAGRKLGDNFRGDLMLANYRGKNGFDDTVKVWLMLSATF